jgi:hypothetical protein
MSNSWITQGLAKGMSHAHLAQAKNMKQLKFMVRNFTAPPEAPQAPPQMPTFTPPRLDQQMASNIGQSESGVQSARKKRGKRTNLASLKINLNPSAKPFGNVGTGLNIGALT